MFLTQRRSLLIFVSFDSSEPSVDDFLESLPGLGCAIDDGFFLRPVTAEEVLGAVKHFSTEAKGIDGIPKSVITVALSSLLPFSYTLQRMLFIVFFSFCMEVVPYSCAWQSQKPILG